MVPPTIRLAAKPFDPANTSSDRSGTLSIQQALQVRVRGVRFEVRSARLEGDVKTIHYGLAIQADETELLECRFEIVEAEVPEKPSRLDLEREAKASETSAVGVFGPGKASVRNCVFTGRRGVGIRLNGRLHAEFEESAFAGQRYAIAVAGEQDAAEISELNLRHCTFKLDRGAAVEATGESARWNVSAGYCVFATDTPSVPPSVLPEGATREMKGAVLKLDDKAPTKFIGRTGEKNIYSFVDPVQGTKSEIAPWVDESAIQLDRTPWFARESEAETATPWSVFRLDSSNADLRIAEPSDEQIVGVRFLPNKDLHAIYEIWPPQKVRSANRHVRIWQPDSNEANLPANTYSTLREALKAAKPDDEIQIRHQGDLEFPKITFDDPLMRLTIKPYPGSNPHIIPAKDDKEGELCRLKEGELTFEGLGFRLGSREEIDSERPRSLIAISDGRRCVLRNCTVTLGAVKNDKPTVIELTETELGGNRGQNTPTIVFENCLIRGAGRAVRVLAARPFDLELNNTVSAVSGSLLEVKAAGTPPLGNVQANIRLNRVTAILGGPFLDLKLDRTKNLAKPFGWIPIDVASERSVFSMTEKAESMIAVDGGDPKALKSVFFWRGTRNVYANHGQDNHFVAVLPMDEPEKPQRLDSEPWFLFTGGSAEKSFGEVKFLKVPERFEDWKPEFASLTAVDIPGINVKDSGAITETVGRAAFQSKPPADRK